MINIRFMVRRLQFQEIGPLKTEQEQLKQLEQQIVTEMDQIEHLKMMIAADEKTWEDLYQEEMEIRAQRERVFTRKYENQLKLKRMLGVDGVL